MLALLGALARHGRFVLVAGLVAGLALPDIAMALRPWLGEMVLFLLFLNAFRVGWPNAVTGLNKLGQTLGVVLSYQLLWPILCLGVFAALGLGQTPVAIALTLMFAAPPVTGGPNMSVMLGHAPEPAFRLLILGTLILPLTLIPIFWLSPALGSLPDAIKAALRLGLSICLVVGAAFVLRALIKSKMRTAETEALDGATSLALAVIVVGLMSALAPALSTSPVHLAGWLCLAFAANFGAQTVAFFTLRKSEAAAQAAPMALVAGNRNVALFLLASSATQSEDFLIFLSCYQFPMYLTPILMRWLLMRKGGHR